LIIIIIIIELYTKYNEKKIQNTKKCIKHSNIDKSIQLTIQNWNRRQLYS